MMDPRELEGSVFNTARRLSATERAAYLDEACAGDAALRQRVEELLDAGVQAADFLENPAPGFESIPSATLPSGSRATLLLQHMPREAPGDRIGRYKLLQQIGEGGCGVVYMAEQQEPVRRQVALKVIKLGMDTKNVVARFEAERQALALMDHPNIAKVLDAGATEAGRPFFVMELVRGVKLTDYCDEHCLPTRERLGLFIQVCQAIQHAHQKGIIHRDIKPSNILVTSNDGVPLPKVIDFGIAKATQQPLTDKTLFTAFEQFIGTPAYMSPEQAEMNAAGVDTRSDIYSLGVLLYELLTGQTPFDSRILMTAGVDEIRRTIREEEPVRPSTRLSRMVPADLTRTAQVRRTEPPRLIHQLRGDLDWIVVKALEKDRNRRYETVNGLARDVQRHLNNEPVVARPPSRWYLLGKLVRRNKLMVGATGAVAATLLIGLGFSTWLFFKERQAGLRTLQAEKLQSQLRKQAETAFAEAKATLEESDFSQAVRLAAQDDAGDALAYLGRILSRNPGNQVALTRMATLLAYHSWMVPTLVLSNSDTVSSAKFSPDGKTLATGSRNQATRIWDSRTGLPLTEVLKHTGSLQSPDSVNFSPDGKWLVTASAGNTARLWNVLTGEPLPHKLKHDAPVRSARFSPDGKWVLTAAQDGAASVWDAQSGRLVAGPMQHDGWVNSAEFSSDGERIVTASFDKKARVWQARDGRLVATLAGHTGWVESACFSPDGKSVLTASYDGTARLWDAQTGRALAPPCLHGDRVCSAQFSPDGQSFITGSLDNAARVWDAHSGRLRAGPLKHGKPVVCVQFSPDGKRIVTASWDATARVWDAQTGLPLFEPMKHRSPLTWAQFSPDGNRVVTACYDGTVLVWDAQILQAHDLPLQHHGRLWSAEFSPDATRLATASEDRTACLWDSWTGQPVGELLKHDAAVRSARFSPDGKRLVTASVDKTARVWDAQTGEPLGAPLKHDGTVRSARFSPDGNRVVTASEDQTARVWDARSGQPVTAPLMHPRWATWAQFSPDGLQVVTCCEDGKGRVWDARSGQLVAQSSLQSGWVTSAQFSPDGRRVVMASEDGTAWVWDSQTGKPLLGPLKHGDVVLSAQFSPDAMSLLTASADQTARLWDAEGGQLLVPFLKHAGGLKSAQFSLDGRLIVTASLDRTARVWDAQTGRPLTEPFTHNGEVWSAQFSPDGRRILTVSEDQAAHIWDLAPMKPKCPAWLLVLAEAISGQTLKKTGVLGETELNRSDTLDRTRLILEQSPEGDDWAEWGRWLLASSATRTVSPFSGTMLHDYQEQPAPQHVGDDDTERLQSVTQPEALSQTALADARSAWPHAPTLSALPNLVVNGGFELGAFSGGMQLLPAPSLNGGDQMRLIPGATDLLGWRVVGPPGTDVCWVGPHNNVSVSAAEGSFSLDLTGFHDSAPYGGVCQTIPTTAGNVYSVSFELATDPGENHLLLPQVAVEATGNPTTIYTVSTTVAHRWQAFSFTFTALTNRTTLTFSGANTNNLAYIGLDDVVVTKVPDTSSPTTQ